MKLDVETMIVGLRAEMSVQEIARRTGLSRRHVHKIAAGEVRRPSYDRFTSQQSSPPVWTPPTSLSSSASSKSASLALRSPRR